MEENFAFYIANPSYEGLKIVENKLITMFFDLQKRVLILQGRIVSTDTDMHELSNFGWQHRLAESVEDANDLFYPASCSKSRNAILYTRT